MPPVDKPISLTRYLIEEQRAGHISADLRLLIEVVARAFAGSGDVISRKCGIPLLCRFELAGTDLDIARIRTGLNRFWRETCLMTA